MAAFGNRLFMFFNNVDIIVTCFYAELSELLGDS